MLACIVSYQNQLADDKLAVAIRLTDGVNTVTRTRRELGFQRVSPDGPVAFTADNTALTAALTRLAPSFAQPAVDARPQWLKGQLTIVPGTFSRTLDPAATAQKLLEAVQRDPTTTQLTVTTVKAPPILIAERLKGITGILGQMTTSTSGDAKRNNNVKIAAEAIDGTLLSPGEVFSLNEIVGKRTQARGYKTATVFVNAETVPGVGGGVSQVTGTLFNAAALAGLEIREVNPHSRPVSYLPLGRDATVAYGDKDLKFVNNTNTPIFIEYTFRDQTLTARLFGAVEPSKTVTLTPNVVRRGPGKIDAELYRIIKTNGKIVAKERLFKHLYRWKPKE